MAEKEQHAMNDFTIQPEPAQSKGNDGFAEAAKKLVDLLAGKQKALALRRKDGPLELLDLPLDILKCIIKEVRAGRGLC